MADYIEREKLPQKKERGFFMDDDFNAGWNACLNNIASIPAADVRPVVRGEWGHRWICSNMSGYEYACSCSVCGEPTYRMSLLEKMPHYCPNCGADMRPTSMSGANGEGI